MGGFFGIPAVNIVATATAEASPANAATCVKPFTIPDRWTERQTPPWDTEDDDLRACRQEGQAGRRTRTSTSLPINRATPATTPIRDRGLPAPAESQQRQQGRPQLLQPLGDPGGNGGSWYRDNIANCNTTVIPDWLTDGRPNPATWSDRPRRVPTT